MIKDIFTREYIGGYYNRNRKLMKIAFIIFILLFIVGFFYFNIDTLGSTSKSIQQIHNTDFNGSGLVDKDQLLSDSNFNGFVSLYYNNLFVDLACVVGGLFLSIPTMYFTVQNVAMFGGIFAKVPLPLLLTSIIPHGIFEIPSSYFGLLGGLMLTQFELRILRGIFSGKSSVKSEWNNSKNLLKDVLLTIILIFILLFIAALIELFVTPYLILAFIG